MFQILFSIILEAILCQNNYFLRDMKFTFLNVPWTIQVTFRLLFFIIYRIPIHDDMQIKPFCKYKKYTIKRR